MVFSKSQDLHNQGFYARLGIPAILGKEGSGSKFKTYIWRLAILKMRNPLHKGLNKVDPFMLQPVCLDCRIYKPGFWTFYVILFVKRKNGLANNNFRKVGGKLLLRYEHALIWHRSMHFRLPFFLQAIHKFSQNLYEIANE